MDEPMYALILIITLLLAAISLIYRFSTKRPEYLKGNKWVGEYNAVKDKIKLKIIHTPENVSLNLGKTHSLTSKSLELFGSLNGISFADKPLSLAANMNNKEFEQAIRSAGIKIESKDLKPATL
ncbi:hypothetical protein MMH89_00850 [Candidatus Comchoanobacter bicostacola]|uniref:Uncharacterized protein n=1 Tax=Candidatus Comchoanobacter bicostacola TaxID=2919598 RepID=A0ABY5DLU1_9GAMM|nr:hypothetical protein [Candidatus Comchoanobacter bicostacola]UTC24712.1 hypothetical protein MMH89_00850 [Candidatus Comchoanobacter bicostacola]